MIKQFDLSELKEMIYTSWYSKKHQEQYDMNWGMGKAKEDIKERELIITEIKDCHHTIGTVVFSINGSPPKGRAILMLNCYFDEWSGDLLLIGRKNKWIYNVKIKKEKMEKTKWQKNKKRNKKKNILVQE